MCSSYTFSLFLFSFANTPTPSVTCDFFSFASQYSNPGSPASSPLSGRRSLPPLAASSPFPVRS